MILTAGLFSRLGVGAAFVSSPLRALAADAYPSRPIHLFVGFTPGSSSDITGRLFANGASQILGQNVVVENKPGAGGGIAAGLGARADSDGYTLYLQALSTLTYKVTHPEAPFDMVKDFAPIALLATGAMVMVVDPKIGVNSVAEFTALAKSKPGQILFGSVGPGSLPDLVRRALCAARRRQARAGALSRQSTGHHGSDGRPRRDEFRHRLLGARPDRFRPSQTSCHCRGQALGLLPDVPTMAEAGIPDFSTPLWFGLLAPKGTPQPAIAKLADAARKAMHAPDALDALHKQGFVADDMGPDQFGAFIKSEIARWSQVAQAAGLVKT